VLALALAQLVKDLVGRRGGAAALGHLEGVADVPPEVAKRRALEMCVWILAYWVAIWLLGFSVSTLLMTVLYLKITARVRWPLALVLSVFAFAFVYGLFEKGLLVPFPPGHLFVWLGFAE